MTAFQLAAILLGATLLAAMPTVVLAQNGSLTIDDVNDDEYPIVEVTVTVPPELGDTRLSKEPFTVTENGRSVKPYLGNSPEVEEPPPPHIVLAIDVSGSMENSIERAKAAADQFVASLPADAVVAVVTFGDEPSVLVEPTTELEAVRSRLAAIDVDVNAETALYAGVRRAANLLSTDGGESGTVVVLSDGENTVRGMSADAAIEALDRHGALLWAVALPGEENFEALRTLASDDGRVLSATNADELDAIYAGLASDLRRIYVLRYESNASGRTELGVTLDADSLRSGHTVQVTIDDRGAVAAGEPPPVTSVEPDVVQVTVPLLGTAGAYVVGLVALASGVFVLLLLVLVPRRRPPRERLFIDQPLNHRQGAKLSTIAQWATDVTDRRLHRGTLGDRLDRDLEGAGLNLRPGELVVVVMSLMVVAYTIGAVTVSTLFGLVLMPMPPLLVRLWLAIRRDKRQAAFSDQLTDVLQLIGSSLRAGYGLTQGIDAVSRDAEEPASGEFRRIIVEHRLGRDLTEAMQNCAARMDNSDFSWVVQAINIHRDVGGDLSKVLDNIVATIRDRADIHREVRTLSAEGRMSARVLTGLPILVLVGLMTMSPGYIQPLFSNPLGLVMLAVAALLMVVGVLVMRRMSKIQY